ncbi:hypothetical protein LQ954_10305 [Sphingomonas sp. IC-11]|uniref:hypothetical protein n=1 Tax=Sphingomonas sp. IC-11 TaxID=2898528 RepID=UPI001E616A90|nr:hypothetical protein [Sphingomonas sp. IC-11]MCD2316541.1 hypothetical protein [Sphingomonas sp. IC-11]
MPHPLPVPIFTDGPITDGHTGAVRHWQSLIDSGLIGKRTHTPPDVAANRDATDRLFREIARDRLRLQRGW